MKKNKPNPDKYGLMLLSISRKDIETFDHIAILDFLNEIKSKAKKYENKFNFLITGYDDDRRELYEIIEVREYFDFLDRCFPYWFYFLKKDLPIRLSPISLLVSLVVPIETIIDKNEQMQTIQLNIPRLQTFLKTHFDFLIELTNEIEIPESEAYRIMQDVMKTIDGIVR